jgi:hemolysin D
MSLLSHLLTIKQSWINETARRKLRRKTFTETDFLPAAVEILERPPSPIGRAILWLIIAAALVGLLWSFASHIETVAVTTGRVVPQGRLQSIEASALSVVKAVHVREGQHVVAGALLLEFDGNEATADLNAARTQYQASSLANSRAGALLYYGHGGSGKSLTGAERSLYDARVAQYEQSRSALRQRLAGAEADVVAKAAEVARMEQVVPISKQKYDSLKGLEEKGYGAHLRTLEAQQDLINQTQSLEMAHAVYDQAVAQVSEIRFSITQLEAQFRVQAASENADSGAEAQVRHEALIKAQDEQDRQSLRAPTAGTVHEIFVNTLGQVVEPAKPLITIVPDGETLIIEALVLNKDVGFVHEGQNVVIKLEAYPFTRYGYLQGKVETILPDSIANDHLGLVYPVRIHINKTQPRMRIKNWKLSPGMTATAEIVTGKRRVVDFLLSPIAKSVREAGRER